MTEELDSLDWADLRGIWDWRLDGRYDPLPESAPAAGSGGSDRPMSDDPHHQAPEHDHPGLDRRQADRLDELLIVVRRLGLAQILAGSDDS